MTLWVLLKNRKELLIIILTAISAPLKGQADSGFVEKVEVLTQVDSLSVLEGERHQDEPVRIRESKRLVAVALCVTLGPFGMHRLYLGTTPEVAAAYTLTLGGGFGFVTVIDLFQLVFSKDISRFRNNPHFIMWKRE